jgi:hypothetical protein
MKSPFLDDAVAGAASFALLFSAKGAGLDAATPDTSARFITHSQNGNPAPLLSILTKASQFIASHSN